MNDYKELIEDLRLGADILSKKGILLFGGEDMTRIADAIEQLVTDIDVVRKERDAAIADLDEVIASADDINWCLYCKHREADGQCHHLCVPCSSEWGWEWRGVQDD